MRLVRHPDNNLGSAAYATLSKYGLSRPQKAKVRMVRSDGNKVGVVRYHIVMSDNVSYKERKSDEQPGV